ncbi:SCP2 domain-containing protein [Streptosporangium jomthongense]|uniref:Ubiquinone biosynthesis accessory factor UbiJ n=1 Tax=Marinobacter aromaticivorans TaxID=1494078 RepID=A0ABW2IQX0_9GAMM|nr:SCP2 sterol-binding domain-containing protein [Marinobacter aromaticivorans]GGE53316.1 SCP2 domain-containing protein [Streptosporangium jomthongense]
MFPGPTLLAALTAIIERAMNRALELDPAGRKALLGALQGPVQFRITDPVVLTFSLHQAGNRVQVHSQPLEKPALEISGKPLAFAALATGDNRVFTDKRLNIAGDTGLAHQFQRALDQLNPDWEAAMASHIGDVPAHFIGKRMRDAVSWSRQAFSTLNANIEEYVHEESRALPGRRELEATFEDIDTLNLRTERLEARVNQLRYRGSTDKPETP